MRKAFRLWLLSRLQPCKQMVLLISESMDRHLTFPERVGLSLHLLVCVWCARYLKQLKFVRAVFRLKNNHSDPDPSAPLLSTEARARIVSSLNRRDESS